MSYQITRLTRCGGPINRLCHLADHFALVVAWLLESLRARWKDWNSPNGLPRDMLDEECTTVLCFKLSVALNVWTGGHQDMTFSARCFGAKRAATARICWLWAIMVAVIDLSCGLLRGEAYHCETAWRNHNAR